MFEHFRILAEAPLPQIHQMARDVDLPLAPRVYAQAVSFFMSGDIERLEILNADVDKHLHSVDNELRKQIGLLIRLRTGLRKQEIQTKDLHEIMSQELPDVLD
ncbi:MAG: hypothetical protein ACXWC9_10840, partial [Pseudobdellovibrionaceae bacterium]